MAQYKRLTSDSSLVDYLTSLEKKIDAQATKGSGDIVITDPDTGVETIIGTLPDGTTGIQPFVGDTTPPPVATQPGVSAQPGNMIVSWDGLFVGGESKPNDFVHVNVVAHKIEAGLTTQSIEVGIIRASLDNVVVSTDIAPVGTVWEFSLISEDYNGNTALNSVRSTQVTQQSVINDALVTDAIDGLNADIAAAQTAAGDAQTAADTAQDAADDAAQSALAASNLAAGKSKTYYQTASPGTTGNSVGDLWVDIDDSYKLYSWSGSAWVQTQDSKAALDLAGTKVRSFVQGTQPTATSVGDIWLNTSNKNELYRWSGSAWVSYRDLSIADADSKAATAIANAATAKDIADGKTASYFQTAAPTGLVATDVGDMWFDTDDGNKMYRWSGTAWVLSDDQRIAATVTAAANAQQVADSKITTFYQDAAPSSTGRTTGDLWVDTDDNNQLYRWSGTVWQSARDRTIANASASASDALVAAQNALNAAQAAQAVADGSIRTWYQANAPTGLNGTSDIGDLWFDTDNGQASRWTGSAWVLIQDNAIATALAAAQNAQTTADGKITSFYQAAQPTTGEVGDLWFDTDDKNKPYYCSSISPLTWTQVRDGAITDAQSTANTALTSANGKNKTYYQTAAPTGGTYIIGDTWIDTDDLNKMYVHNGTTWVSAQDGAIDAANNLAASKGKVLIQTGTPAVADQLPQNLWIDTTNGANTPKRWNGSAWVAVTDKAATDAATAAATAQSKADLAFNNAASAATAAGNAQTTADGKNRNWYQTTAPAGTSHRDGDQWFDTANGNKLYLWKASTTTWTAFQDAAIATAQGAANAAQTTANNAQTAAGTASSAASTAQTTANTAVTNAQTAQNKADQATADALAASNLAASKGKVLYQTSAPTGVDANAQTLWIDTTGNLNTPKRWVSGTTWAAVTDKVAADAAALAATKGKILYQTSAPTGVDANDLTLWIDTTGGANTPKKWVSGTTWISLTDKVATDAAALAATKGKVLFQTSAPTGVDANAQTLWIDTTNGLNKPMKWVSGTTWTAITDKVAIDAATAAANAQSAASAAQGDATTAIANAATAQTKADQAFNNAATAATAAGNAQTTANGKNRAWYQTSAPTGTGHTDGDQWYDTDDGNKLYLWKGTPTLAWTAFQDAAIGLAQTAANNAATAASTAQTAANNAQTSANTASTAASTAQTDATTAKNNAATADAKAVQALSDALAANNLAASKGKVLYQTTAPTGADANLQTLWIDTTSNLNTPKRWVSGTTWTTVTDKVATDAAALAATKGKILYQTTAPTGADANDLTLWIDTTGGANTPKKWVSGTTWTSLTDKVASDAAALAATKTKTYFQGTQPGLTGNTAGDLWFDTANGNKAYVWNGSWTVAQDASINKSLFGTFTTDIDNQSPNKWMFTKYDKVTSSSTIPSYLDIVGVAGTSSLVVDGTNLVQSVGDNYIGQLRTVINVVSGKTITFTATHDDGAQVYVDGVSVYTKNAYTANASISFTVSAGWHVIDMLWAEAAGGDGFYAISPTIGSQVTSMFAPVSLSSTTKAVADATTLATSKGEVIYSTTTPSAAQQLTQNLWIDTTGGANTPKRWNGSAWVAITDKAALDAAAAAVAAQNTANTATTNAATAQTKADQAFNNAAAAATAAGNAQTSADLKNRIWYQTTAPAGTGHKDGDTWYDTANGNKIYLWKTSTLTWTAFQDAAIATAQSAATSAASAASTAQGRADQAVADALAASNLAATKGKVLYQTSAPTGVDANSQTLWIDTTNNLNTPMKWVSGTTWVAVTDKAATDAAALAATKGKILYQTTAPTGADANALTLWIDTTGGANTPMKWVSGTTWSSLTDKVASDAAALAASKGKVLVQGTAPTGADANAQTLWIDTTNGNNTPMKWVSGTTWAAVTDKTATDAASLAATKGKVLVQTTAPTGVDANASTLWIDSTGGANTPKRWVSGTTWTAVTDKVATDAATLAATKGKVLIQSAAPASADQLPQNLWIDTTANANTPKKWNTGTLVWDVVTDKAATDAAAAAVTAQNTANSAQTAAGTAQTTANNAMTAANGKSAIYFSTAAPSGVGTKYGDIWFQRDGAGTITGQWEWVAGTPDAWASRTISDTVLGNISAGKLVAGWIQGGEIKAGSITADKLTIGDFTNLLDDPDFNIASGNYVGWNGLSGQTSIVSVTGVEGAATTSMRMVANGTVIDSLNKNVIPTQAGEKYYGEVYVKQDGLGTTGNLHFAATVKLADGSLTYPVFQQVLTTAVTTSWTKIKGVITMPTNAVSFQPRLSVRNDATNGTFWFEHAIVRRQSNATTIADGSIVTTHMTAGTIDASVLTAGSVKAVQLGAKSVTADKLLVTSTENIIQEADFGGSGASWELPANFVINTTAGRNSLAAMVITNTAALQTSYSAVGAPTKVPIEYYSDGGNAYRLSAWVNSSVVVPTSGAYISARFRSSTGAYTIQNVFYMTGTPAVLATIPANTWTEITGIVTAPADTISVAFSINSAATLSTGTIKFDSVGALRAATGELIVDGSITAGKIAAGAVTTGSMTSGTIDAGVLVAGSITAPKIAGKSISADKLLISSTDNLINEADFKGAGASWDMTAGFAIGATSSRISLPAMVTTNSASLQTAYNAVGSPTKVPIEFPTTPGTAYRVSVWVKSTVVVPTSGAYVSARFTQSSGGPTTLTAVYVTPGTQTPATIAANTWTELVGMFVAPANSVSVAFAINSAATLSTGTITWDTVAVTRASNGELIVDGSIKTQHMTSGTIDAGILAAGSITTPKLAAKSVTMEKLVISSFDNVIAEPDFTNGGSGWGLSAGYVIDPTGGRKASTPALKITNDATQNGKYNLPSDVPVSPSSSYYLSAWIRSDVAIPLNGVSIYVKTKDVMGNYTITAAVQSPAIAANTWAEISGRFTLPANAATVSFGIFSETNFSTGSLWTDYVSATRAANGQLIVDGAITTRTLDANVVTADKLAAKSVTADKMVIGRGANIFSDPEFMETIDGKGWPVADATYSYGAVGSGMVEGRTLTIAGSAVQSIAYHGATSTERRMPVVGGFTYRVSAWVKSSVALSISGAALFFRAYKADGTTFVQAFNTPGTSSSNLSAAAANVWVEVTGSFDVPAGDYVTASVGLAKNPTQTDPITWSHVTVQPAASGQLIVDGSITATKLVTDLVLTTKIIAGDPAGTRAEMAPTGFRVWAKEDPLDPLEVPHEAVKMGTSDNDYFAVIKADGSYASTMAQDGTISGQQLTVTNDIEWKGNSLNETIDALPKGIVAWGSRSDSSPYWASGFNFQPYLSLTFNGIGGRAYRVWSTPITAAGNSTTAFPMVNLHYGNGTTATVATAKISQLIYDYNGTSADRRNSLTFNRLVTPSSDGPLSLLISYGAALANGGQSKIIATGAADAVILVVEDIGLAPSETGESPNGSADAGTTNPTPPPAKVNYVKTYYPTATKSYDGSGNQYNYNTAYMYTGLSPAGYGDMRSLAVFNSNIATDIGAGTVTKVRVYAYYDHWYNNSGGTADITAYGGSTIPATLSSVSGTPATSTAWPKPGGRWVTLSSSTFAGFKAGTTRGVIFGGKGRGYLGYGYLHDVRLEVSYTK